MKLLYPLIILFAYVFPNSNSIKAYDEGGRLVYNINIGEQILITMIDGKEYYGSLYSNSSGNNSFQLKYNPKKHATFFSKRKFNYDEIKFIQVGEGVIEKKYLIAGISGAAGLYLSTYIFMFPGSCGICGPQGGLPAIYIRTFFAIGGLIGGIAQEYAIDLPESYGNRLRIYK